MYEYSEIVVITGWGMDAAALTNFAEVQAVFRSHGKGAQLEVGIFFFFREREHVFLFSCV